MIGAGISRTLAGCFDEFLPGAAAVALVGQFLQDVLQAGLGAQFGLLADAQALGDLVGGLEADARDISGQPVWVLGDLLDRLVPVRLVDAKGPAGADAVAVQKDHDLPDHLLLVPTPR